MGQITLPDDTLRKLREIAAREDKSVEELLVDVADKLSHDEKNPTSSREEMAGKFDDDIPDLSATRLHSIVEEQQLRQLRTKLYRMAREYWQKEGNQERLALTDADLDEQFWLFDQDGIPRLKSDKGTIPEPDNPGLSLAGMFDLGVTDAASQVDEWRREHFKARFGNDR